MKVKARKGVIALFGAVFCTVLPAYAQKGLSPQDFNKMYYLASQGRVAILRDAIGRGLDIDSVNPQGDTGLCIAIKRNNYQAYNSFRQAGANPRHQCTFRIYKEYQSFLENNSSLHTKTVMDNSRSLYYTSADFSWWPWILGAAAVGGGVWALGNSGGSSSSSSGNGNSSTTDDGELIPTVEHGYGLAGYLDNYTFLVNGGEKTNTSVIDAGNSKAESVINKIDFLPNVVDNYAYLNVYTKVINGASYHNLSGGHLLLGNAAVAMASYGDGSQVLNDGIIDITAQNGTIGMAASNGAVAINGKEEGNSQTTGDGSIHMIFKGGKEGDAIIGMYGDTHSSVTNYGKISGTTAQAETSSSDSATSDTEDGGLLGDVDSDLETVIAPNSGTMIGMGVFNLYSGKDFSNYTISAKNYGDITLLAGHNNASDVATNLIGMGSYLADAFLNGKNNPAFAEQIILQNLGNINLSYQKTYNLANDALKIGEGGLIGIRADASSGAINQGKITIDMQGTAFSSDTDVAAGMLSLHGAGLVNGSVSSIYDGTGSDTGGTIQIINESTTGGMTYGMLAAKGSGTQTSLYKWQTPFLRNYGLIDMLVSNSYGMASFAGGDVINDGVINLGVEKGQSYYRNDYGIYASGSSTTEEVSLINNGTINVNSELSSAIYNAFAGSVTETNNGTIYLSNKATDSMAFGGNYSKAVNYGDIIYKVGNSHNYSHVVGKRGDIGFAVKTVPSAAVIKASGDSSSTKQYVVNETGGNITIAAAFNPNVDYGGTYGVAGIQVSKQGSADNKGNILIENFDDDIMQFNTGMYLDGSATEEAYGNNYGKITVNATNSVGMWNNSSGSMTNFGDIFVNGLYSYGMAVSKTGANLFNGRLNSIEGEVKNIYVSGEGSIGMMAYNGGNIYNYGTIYLLGHHTTGFQISGAAAKVIHFGNIVHGDELEDVAYLWVTNGAEYTFESNGTTTIEGYILGKATTDSSGGKLYLSSSSSASVKGSNSRLFVADGSGSVVYNEGKVDVSEGAIALSAENGGGAYNNSRYAVLTVKDDSSIGIYGADSGTTVGTVVASNLNVEAGIGIKVENTAKAQNVGNITVTGGKGMFLRDGGSSSYTEGSNSGKIVVTGEKNIGVHVIEGARFTNSGAMEVSATAGSNATTMAKAISSDSVVTNGSDGKITVGANSIGIYATGGTLTNSGEIYIDGSNAYGIYNAGALKAENSGIIEVRDGIGVYGKIDNSGQIIVRSGVGAQGNVSNTGSVTVNSGIGLQGNVENGGTIEVKGGIGVEGYGSNSGTIINNGGDEAVKVTGSFVNSGTINGTGTGVLVDGGLFRNDSSISMSKGIGVLVKNKDSSATNDGTINVSSGIGMKVSAGVIENNSTITVGGGTGMYVGSGASGYNNAGATITLSELGYGVYVEGGGNFTNMGTIVYNSKNGGECANIGVGGTCNDLASKEEESEEGASSSSVLPQIVIENGASFVNQGEVKLADIDVDFGDDGSYVVASGGQYMASSFKGKIVADTDIVLNGFDDVYTEVNALQGENRGLTAVSKSYMFDAHIKTTDEQNDVVLERKDFNDLIEEKELANFFEANYKAGNNEKMYKSLKSASNAGVFNAVAESETGKKFYANLPRENMAVLRGVHHEAERLILEDGLNGGIAGASYFRTGKDGNGILSEYSDDVYSLYAGYGTKLSHDWSIGGAIQGSYADSSYDNISSERENKIVMAFLPIMYQHNRAKFLTMPSVGLGFGSYTRKTLDNQYDADTFDIYYGLYNHAEYSIDMKVAELVAEAELNLQGVSSDTAKEDGGFNLKNHNSTSLEGGIGLKLRKRIRLAKERELVLALGTKYYHEFLDPYKKLSIATNAASYNLNGYDENDDRLRTSAEALYRDGAFAVSAEIAHNAEKESNVEGNVGVRYNF